MDSQIKNKIKDLLSLSKDGANLNESTNAYKLAQKLLIKHNLSMVDISLDKDNNEPIITSEAPLYVGKRAITWKGRLAHTICEANNCFCYWHLKYENYHLIRKLVVVGRKSDIETVDWLYKTISSQIEIFCVNAILVYGGGKTFANNFKLGAINAVSSRLKEAKQEVESEYIGTKAMVHIDQIQKKLKEKQKELKLLTYKVQYREHKDGYVAGVVAGNNISLAKGNLDRPTKRYLK